MPTKRVPLRKCIGCGEMKEKRALVRVVRSADGAIALDTVGKAAGRGAYLCPNAECLRVARKARRLEKAFACAIPSEVYDRIEEALTQHDG